MTPLTGLKGIGEKTAALYAKLGINDVEDAVFYYPRDYIRYEQISKAEELMPDRLVAIEATVVKRPLVRKIRRLTITTVILSCESIPISVTWFNMPYLAQSLEKGKSYVFRGRITIEGDRYHMQQPAIFSREEYDELCGHINPVYNLTKGLTNKAVTKTVRRSFEYLEGKYEKELFDIHFPKDEDTLTNARNKLVYDEFLQFIIKLRLLNGNNERISNDFGLIDTAVCSRIIEKLPYELTNAQKRVWDEVRDDLCSDVSMRRLIQGDVGSGKTIIAALSAILVAANNKQCAIMAPTEILAAQHHESLISLLAQNGLDIKCVLLTGNMSAAAKRNVLSMIEKGEAKIVIGTHALFQDKVIYDDLALVITDEQHRFGVGQRVGLAQKSNNDNAHVLVMSATPIPRTLSLIMYGDLSISVIDEVPAHKLPVKNAVVNENFRKSAYKHIEKEIRAGHQAYVICPLIEESEGLEAKNVTDTAAELESQFDNSIRVGILHGKMKADKKQKIMDEFAAGLIDILVSTTVVEVGINVPNATVMMIENADRFGLAALHQLRGRIGRGTAQSYCIFMSASAAPETMERLEILKNNNDGFKIAEEDLKMRGPGDMFGFRQSGDVRFRLGDIYSDSAILKQAANDADRIISEDPLLQNEEHSKLRSAVLEDNRIYGIGASI